MMRPHGAPLTTEPTRAGAGVMPQELNGAAKATNQRYRGARTATSNVGGGRSWPRFSFVDQKRKLMAACVTSPAATVVRGSKRTAADAAVLGRPTGRSSVNLDPGAGDAKSAVASLSSSNLSINLLIGLEWTKIMQWMGLKFVCYHLVPLLKTSIPSHFI